MQSIRKGWQSQAGRMRSAATRKLREERLRELREALRRPCQGCDSIQVTSKIRPRADGQGVAYLCADCAVLDTIEPC